MPWGERDQTPIERRFPGVRAECIERGDLIPRDRIDQVLALLGIRSPDTVAALMIDGIANDEGQWRGQVTVIRRSTTRRRIDGVGLNGPARFVEHTTEHRSTAQIIDTPETE